MKNTPVKFLFLLLINFTLVISATAWDEIGHKLTTYIAWEQMSPQTREKAFEILMSAPEDAHLSVYYSRDSRSAAIRQREFFMIASIWADIVRAKEFKNRYAKYHKGDWHYADTFWRVTDGKINVIKDFAEPKGKAVEQLFAFDKLLRDAGATDADKAIALAWVLHLGGDIHQPLHTSARVTENNPQGDQGGNRFWLSPKEATGDARYNLHWFWDSIIGRTIPRFYDAGDSEYVPPIAQEIMKKYPSAKMQSRLKPGKFDDWQQEGFQIASTKLYPETLRFGEAPPENYKKGAFEIAEEQIALAGYRMGAMLNEIFDNQIVSKGNYQADKANFENPSQTSGGNIEQDANDARLWVKSRSALASTSSLRESTINVDVANSVITLRGTLPDKKQKEIAVKIVKNIEGVKSVIDLLKISK